MTNTTATTETKTIAVKLPLVQHDFLKQLSIIQGTTMQGVLLGLLANVRANYTLDPTGRWYIPIA